MTQPVLVLHSDDDPIVPAYLGQRLVDRTKEAGEDDHDDDGDEEDEEDEDWLTNVSLQARRTFS